MCEYTKTCKQYANICKYMQTVYKIYAKNKKTI